MNTAAYIDLFEDALVGLAIDPQARPVRYQLEYLRPAASGVVLRWVVWQEADGVIVIATLPDGTPAFRSRRDRDGPRGSTANGAGPVPGAIRS